MLRNIISGVVMLLCTVWVSWILITCVKDAYKAFAARNWPATTGVIVSSKVFKGCSKSYNPTILYQYKVGSTFYVGDRLIFGLAECSSQSEAQAIVSKYPEKLTVTVHFNPELPSEAVMRVGMVSNGTWWFIFTIPFMIAIGTSASWLLLRHVRSTNGYD